MARGIARRVTVAVLSAVLVVGLFPSAAFATAGSKAASSAGQTLLDAGASGASSPNAHDALRSASIDKRALAVQKSKKSKVAKFKYSAKPILKPFCTAIYVKTNNPDPDSFRLVDKKNRYEAQGQDMAVYHKVATTFADVKYVNKKTERVKGGYIFHCSSSWSDGGVLTVQQRNSDDTYTDTKVKVKLPKLMNHIDYLISTYAKGKKGFFEKLDAVQAALEELSVYPRLLYSSKKTGFWPLLAASPYAELGLNEHYDSVYKESDKGVLAQWINPFVLDSLGFPDLMASVAGKLNPKCELAENQYHWGVDVTLNGTTKTYGGAGNCGAGSLLSSVVKKNFKFDKSSSDLAFKSSVAKLTKTYCKYVKKTDAKMKKYRDMIGQPALKKAVGKGGWARIGVEGFLGGGGNAYAYITCSEIGGEAYPVADTWVDGRYVDSYEAHVPGAKFSEHPKASILIRNKSVVDAEGKRHTCDMLYNYRANEDAWYGPYESFGYHEDFVEGIGWQLDVPDGFILTPDQVSKMDLDKNTDQFPAKAVCFDGDKRPGTPISNKPAKSVKLAKKATVYVGNTKKLSVKVLPKKATEKALEWTSKNPKVADVESDGTVTAKKSGKAKIVVRALNGGCTATCTVTVKKLRNIAKAKIDKIPTQKHTWPNYAKDVNPVVRYGGKKLVEGKDYTVKRTWVGSTAKGVGSNRRDIDKYKVVVEGMGIYKGKKSTTYKIVTSYA